LLFIEIARATEMAAGAFYRKPRDRACGCPPPALQAAAAGGARAFAAISRIKTIPE